MHGMEDIMQRFTVRPVQAETDQEGFEGGQVFPGFLEEYLEKLAYILGYGIPPAGKRGSG